MKLVSIIIVNYNLAEEVRNLLKSIEHNVEKIDYYLSTYATIIIAITIIVFVIFAVKYIYNRSKA